MFPLDAKQSATEWWNRKTMEQAEAAVLEYAGIHTKGPKPNAKSIDTPIGKGLHINELEIPGPEIPGKPQKHIVFVHGYGAAKGFFFKNLLPLALPGHILHAVDWLGYGRSSRPAFKIKPKTRLEGVQLAESFFVDSLEEWRKARGIEEFSLIAHSLGAYCGAAYALKYPGRVDKLMMVSPAAVMRGEDSLTMEVVGTLPDSEIPIAERMFDTPGWFKWLWERGISPFWLVCLGGPLGPKFASAWTFSRFRDFPDNERQALHEYAYLLFSSKGSGVYCLKYLLTPGASARWPLAERISPLKVPTLWVYGDKDWMDIKGGREAARQIKRAGGPEARVVEVEGAGHHVYLDNMKRFNELAVEFIENKVEDVRLSHVKDISV